MAEPVEQQVTGPSLAQLGRVRAEILAAAARHGATNVRVFGSVARGDADVASDVDFLVDFEPGRSCSTWPVFSWTSRISLAAPWMSSPSRVSRPGSVSECWPRRSRFEKRPRAPAGHPRGGRARRGSDRPGRAAFADDDLVQTAVIRWVEIIGEASRGLTDELRQAHPEVPWRQMVAMRNVLIHGYFDIDVDLVWSAAVNDLPKLAAQIRIILDDNP